MDGASVSSITHASIVAPREDGVTGKLAGVMRS